MGFTWAVIAVQIANQPTGCPFQPRPAMKSKIKRRKARVPTILLVLEVLTRLPPEKLEQFAKALPKILSKTKSL